MGRIFGSVIDGLELPWERNRTEAHGSAQVGLAVPRGVMAFASGGRGNKAKEQAPLYLSAITFSYAVWENYVEDLAVELSERLTIILDPSLVPGSMRDQIEKQSNTWQIAVEPGWRSLWHAQVLRRTKGTGKEHGLNDATKEKVDSIFAMVGLMPVPDRIKPPSTVGTGASRARPEDIVAVGKDKKTDVGEALDLLFGIRGQAVHTASTLQPLYKNETIWWTDFVSLLIDQTDERARKECRELVERSAPKGLI